jgi:ATP-dependent DNA helicase RecG
LLEEGIEFDRLSLIVIDEQHRFGVRQRASLRRKGDLIDLLIMTATPIPRTLALSLYGDLDASTIDEMPPGKALAETSIVGEAAAFERVRTQVAAGRQAYVVYPIIEESSAADLQSAKTAYARLKDEVFKEFRVGIVHGAMPGKQKTAAMKDFTEGKTQILVATQVIEVGIDVSNATVMVIQNAERFGLASLHQLRGRVGRGAAQSFCYLVGRPQSPQAQERLETLAATHDGFRIGEEDLKLRGPGEFLGTAQHGELELKVADLSKDAALVLQARADAEKLLDADPTLSADGHAGLRGRLLALYQRQWDWIDLS